MNKTLTVIVICISSIALAAGSAYFGICQFTRSIYHERSCEWSNIDNIETHTGIDIPKILRSDCKYDKDQNTKFAWFDIDKGLEMTTYIRRNKLKKLEKSEDFDPAVFLDGENIKLNNVPASELYYTEGSYDKESWKALLDTSKGKLWITLKYKD